MRIARKATKGKGRKSWRKGDSAISNPALKKYREKARSLLPFASPSMTTTPAPSVNDLTKLTPKGKNVQKKRKAELPEKSESQSLNPQKRRKTEDTGIYSADPPSSDDEDDYEDVPEDVTDEARQVYKPGGKGIHRNIKDDSAVKIGREFRSRKGKGDVKRKGQTVDPYAYIPLMRTALNRRKKNSSKGQFKHLMSKR